ncbi:MAG: DUF1836 domain-containing protein [Ruminococcus sp.]|nr:DUF1836 domain-containing protein [Ruminococcus sp.]
MKYTPSAHDAAFSVIAPILEAAGGLTLSQLSGITGLEGSTIQNWIKRGWVSPGKGKKYSEKQILRILIINMLRGAMTLENIARLMTYINGDVEDTSDDIIEDIELYNCLCRIIFNAGEQEAFTPDEVNAIILTEINSLDKPVRANGEKLHKAMYVCIMAYRSAVLRSEAEAAMQGILAEIKP